MFDEQYKFIICMLTAQFSLKDISKAAIFNDKNGI